MAPVIESVGARLLIVLQLGDSGRVMKRLPR